jgi:3-deoxy-D-manno-octulosonic-acid transferase
MRDRLGLREDEWLIVAGSTHAGEEEILADCYRTIARRHPAVRLLLAPRHIERADSVEAMLRSKGLAVRRRNRLDQTGRTTGDEPEVILLDTRGELASMYQEAIVAFVGGTLVPVGGHNLLEPAAWAKPVLFGPYTDHCAEIAGLLVQSGGGRRVAGAEALTRELLRLLEQPEEREAAGLRARAVVEQNQGAIQSTADAIDRVLALTYSDTSPVWSRDPVPLAAGR